MRAAPQVLLQPALRGLRAHGATVFAYIGELCRYLLASEVKPAEKRHKLRMVVGAGLRPDIWEAFVKRFNIPEVREFYGATEGNVGIVNFDGKPGMLGRLMPGQVVALAEEGTADVARDASTKLCARRPSRARTASCWARSTR
ncbi:MAG: AMP-binding protein [Sandaracinaceae bacterium]|nr:AMP-binding protein [Sandaracinaceae bacterium]